jgi:hypothetical protein
LKLVNHCPCAHTRAVIDFPEGVGEQIRKR